MWDLNTIIRMNREAVEAAAARRAEADAIRQAVLARRPRKARVIASYVLDGRIITPKAN